MGAENNFLDLYVCFLRCWLVFVVYLVGELSYH